MTAEYFQNKLVDTIHFMEILNLKDSVEKDTFFRKLPTLAEQLPRQIVLKKVLFDSQFVTLNLVNLTVTYFLCISISYFLY